MQKEIFLQANNISKSFAGVKALQAVDFDISKGEILCLVGENGSGKSTLIKIISGVLKPDSGTICINGNSYKSLTTMESVKEGIQVIYQDFSLFPNLTIAENISTNYLLSANRKLVNWKQVRLTSQEALNRINISLDPNLLVSDLSIAQQQLVAISRAILQNAKLIIMDEPTTALTSREVDKLFTVISDLKSKGCCVIFVSHKLDEVKEISERIMILRNGQKVIEASAQTFDTDKMTFYISGRNIEKTRYNYEKPENDEDAVLKVENLTLNNHFKNVSFEVQKGEILGFTGLLGSGRTELALSLFGIKKADGGDIFVGGVKKQINCIKDAIDCSIGYVPEDRLTEGLFLENSIRDNVLVRIINESGKYFTNNKMLGAQAQKLVESLSIKTNSIELPAKSLSGGNQQRVVLAKWLSRLPRILILNGPTVGVDIGSKSEIHKTLRELAKNGMTIIVMSDDIPELVQLCNRLFIIKEGRLTNHFFTSEVNDEKLIYAALA